MIYKIPLYLEINLPAHGGDDVLRVVSKIKERKQPIIINLNLKSFDEALEFMQKVKIDAAILTKRDLLPYPIYLIAEKDLGLQPFLCFTNINDVPQYYRREQSKLNSKEASLLNNIQIIHDKISNLNLTDRFSQYSDYLSKNKKLHQLILENRFLEDVLEGIKRNE